MITQRIRESDCRHGIERGITAMSQAAVPAQTSTSLPRHDIASEQDCDGWHLSMGVYIDVRVTKEGIMHMTCVA